MTSAGSIEAQAAEERRKRAAIHHEVQHGAFGVGHISYVPPELLAVLVSPREGSRFHKVLPEPGAGGAGSGPLNASELDCALALNPQLAAMAAAAEGAS